MNINKSLTSTEFDSNINEMNILILFMGLKLPVKIYIDDYRQIRELQKKGLMIENVIYNYVETHLSREEIEKWREMGYKVEITKEVTPKAGYHSYREIERKLHWIASTYPEITHLISIGKSVEGRDIWAIKISDNPQSCEYEPKVRFAATIHGDEPPGTEVLLALIDTLTKNYGKNDKITELVNTREIWIIPLANPDGYVNHSRYNANGVDLNRNFPVPDGSIGGDGTYELEPETQALITFQDTANLTLGCMFHTGALVVNYQWDYTYDVPPDDVLIDKIAREYARRNPMIYYSTSVQTADSGVVRGARWYIVKGSLQDYSYHINGFIDLTIEISVTKWPDTTLLKQIINENIEPLLFFIEKAGDGLYGIVFDTVNMCPVMCEIKVENLQSVYSCGNGYYKKLLLTGNYNVNFSSPGYYPASFVINANYDSSTNLNVKLTPYYKDAFLIGKVTDAFTGAPLRCKVTTIYRGETTSTLTDDNGNYILKFWEGIWEKLIFEATGYEKLFEKYFAVKGTVFKNVSLIPFFSFSSETTETIPDTKVLKSRIFIAESLMIKEMEVYLHINHPDFSELVIYIESPEGKFVKLWDMNFATGDVEMWFERDISADSGSLTWYENTCAKGYWTLHIEDKKEGNTGVLLGWKIKVIPYCIAEKKIAQHEFKIYPNPGKSFTIYSSFTPYLFEIYDICGRKIYSTMVDNNLQNLNLSLPDGVYFFRAKYPLCEYFKKVVVIK